MVYYLSIYCINKHFKPCFFILKALKDILQHFKFVTWRFRFFDVTNRLYFAMLFCLQQRHTILCHSALQFRELICNAMLRTYWSATKYEIFTSFNQMGINIWEVAWFGNSDSVDKSCISFLLLRKGLPAKNLFCHLWKSIWICNFFVVSKFL